MFSLFRLSARTSARVEAVLSTHAFTFLFLIMYFLSVALFALWGFRSQFVAEPNHVLRWYISTARAAGYVLNLNTALVILLASRLFLTALRTSVLAEYLPLDKAFPNIHIIVAVVIAIAVAVHVPFHLTWIIHWNRWKGGLFQINMSVMTGFFLLTVFAILLIFARKSVRKANFRLFYAVHLFCGALFFILLLMHGMYYARPETYKYVVGPLAIYLLDRVLRISRIARINLDISAAHAIFKDGDILQLRVPKPFKFRAGQYAEIRVPAINGEWHPFTIASADHEEIMSFYIKALGDWTKELHGEFQKRVSGTSQVPLTLHIRGPFGAPSQHVESFERVVLVSGGIGSTPFSSICKQLNHLHQAHRPCLPTACSDYTIASEGCKLLVRAEKSMARNLTRMYGLDFELDDSMSVICIDETESVTDNDEMICELGNHIADMVRLTSSIANDQDALPNRSNHGRGSPKKLSVRLPKIPSKAKIMSSLNMSDSDGALTVDLSDLEEGKWSTTDAANSKRLDASFGLRSSILRFLHTTRVQFILLVLVVLRCSVLVTAAIFHVTNYVLSNNTAWNMMMGRWVASAYVTLGSPLLLALPFVTILETSLLKMRVFASWTRMVELIIFLVGTVAGTVLDVHRIIDLGYGTPVVALIQYIVLPSATFILLCGRMRRSIARQGLLADKRRSKSADDVNGRDSNVPQVDFVWTTAFDSDDEWLRRELKPLIVDYNDLSSAVKLQRYVTRGAPAESSSSDSGDLSANSEPFADVTKTGRPDWETTLARIARSTPSDGAVGIFFCGPPAMGQAVRRAARKVEMWSNLRGAYLAATDDETVRNQLAIHEDLDVDDLRKVGCGVRFVFREENFS